MRQRNFDYDTHNTEELHLNKNKKSIAVLEAL